VNDIAGNRADAGRDSWGVDEAYDKLLRVFVVRGFGDDTFAYRIEGWPKDGVKLLAVLTRSPELDKAPLKRRHARCGRMSRSPWNFGGGPVM